MKNNTQLVSIIPIFILLCLTAMASPVYAKVESASGAGTTEALACEQAKMLVQKYCEGSVDSFENCNSCNMQIVNGQEEWTCQVDGRCGERTGTGLAKPLY